jgi:NADPH-dependent ferric siderophore reductase
MPQDVRPIMRTFTIRSQDGDLLDVEFALHGDTGPASAFARHARPGDRLGIIGAVAGEERLAMHYDPGDARSFVLVGDDTALPAVASIVEALPATASAQVFLQVPDAGDIRELSTAADVKVDWSVRTGLADAVRRAPLPAGTPYAWVAGESALVRDVRSYLVGDLGWSSRANYFGGYWKAGETE